MVKSDAVGQRQGIGGAPGRRALDADDLKIARCRRNHQLVVAFGGGDFDERSRALRQEPDGGAAP